VIDILRFAVYVVSYKLDEGIGNRARIGIIALPDDQNIEHELHIMTSIFL
jgi:hypothetical protein